MRYRTVEPGAVPYQPSQGIFAPGASTDYLPLSGTWNLHLGEDNVHQVTVPGCWVMGEGPATLTTSFTIPDGWEDRHLRLVFWGARRSLSIKLNNRLVEAWDSDWPTVVVDLPRSLLKLDRANELEIEVRDDLSARSTIPLKPKLYDVVNYAGLFGDVALVAGPTASLEQVNWDIVVAEDHSRADWRLDVGLRSHKPVGTDTVASREIEVWMEWAGPRGVERGATDSVRITLDPIEISQLSLRGSIQQPDLWSLDTPDLYQFRLHFRDAEKEWDTPFRIGLARIVWQPDQLLLNGVPIEVRGVDLRQETVPSGNALSLDQVRYDLQRAKAQGFNLVRIIGEPPHPATAAICDELGLLLVPTLGLRGVPEPIFTSPEFAERLDKMLQSLVRRDGQHVSIPAWGLVDWAAGRGATFRLIEALRERVLALDDRPLMVGVAQRHAVDLPAGVVGIRQRPPYSLFDPLRPVHRGGASAEDVWLVGGLGGYVARASADEDSIRGQVRQADALLHQLHDVREMETAGFIVDSYADRRSSWPLLISGDRDQTDFVPRGLLTKKREARIAWDKLGEAIGQVRIEVPTLEKQAAQFPILFPMATMILLGFLLLFMRQNNVFRQNLQRVYAHTHGFFVDIRDRRYFQSGQTFIVALLIAAGHAILTASWLYHSRTDFGLDYLLTLLVPIFEAKELLVRWAWDPLQGIAAFSAIFFFLQLLLAALLRLISLPFRGRLKYRQAFTLVVWAATHFFLLFPVGWVHYRFLDFGWFRWALAILLGLFWLWYVIRLASIIRIGYRVSARTAWLIIILIVLLLGGSWIAVFRSLFAAVDYLEFFRHVIMPWAMG